MNVVGTVVADRFEVERSVASGGMGSVYRARDRITGAEVALKIAHADLARFEREIRLLATLDHPRIVRYVAHGTTNAGQQWVAMEWIQGETLARVVSRRTLEIEECITIGRSLAEALAAAHVRGIVHRDVKPGNVMLEGGLIEAVRLIDFGVARAENEVTISTGATLIGTPSYMSPEQARGELSIGPEADVFALGSVLYRCLTGRPPFIGDGAVAVLAKVILEEPIPISELRPEVPRALEDLITSMMAKGHEQRPKDGRAVVARMQTLSDSHRAPPPSHRALTGQEQRVAAVVMVGPSDDPNRVRAIVERELGNAARIERVRDGSIVVLVRGRGTAADEAVGAANAALALRVEVADVPIAIATGRAEVAGDRPAVGEALDRASALLRTTNLGQITLDAVTESLLDERFTRHETLLLGRAEGGGGRRLLGRVTPFVGREAELTTAFSIVTQSADDRMAKALLVVGAAGSGKSRLRHELVSRIEESRIADVWIARADPMGVQTPLGVASQMLRQLAGVREGDALDDQRAALRDRIARWLPAAEVNRVTAFLGESIGIAVRSDALAATRDPVLLGDQIRRAWMDLLDAETAAHPLVVVLEDLHWADRPTVALFDAALSFFADRPLAIVGFARPEIDQAFPSLFAERTSQRVQLGPLGKRASEQLVHAMLGARGNAVASTLVEMSGGNAFYLEELIRAAAEGRETLPQSVLAMAQSRIEALEADERRILRAASVFGRVFWEEGVASLLGATGAVPAHELQRRLERLVSAEVVIRRRESTFGGTAELSFRHTLLREGAYAMLTDADRALGHGLAGEWLEARGSTDAAAVGEHFERGGQAVRAAAWFVRAAEDALEANDLVGVLDLANRARPNCRDDALLGKVCALEAAALRWQGRLQECREKAEEAIHLVPAGAPEWCDAQSARATALLAMGRGEELATLHREMLPVLLEGTASARVLDAAAHIGRCLLQGGRPDLAEAMLAPVERGAPDPAIRGRIEYARSFQAVYAGESSKALDLTLHAIGLLDAGGDARMAVSARINIGYTYLCLGQFDDAEVLLREALDAAQRLGLVTSVIGAKENLGWTVARLGRLQEAAKIERETVAASLRSGDRRFEGGARIYLSSILLRAGDVAGAEREARAAIDVVSAVPPMLACALAALADVLLATHRNVEALAAAERAMEITATGGVSEEEGGIRLTHAESLWANGHHDAAKQAITAAQARLQDRATRIDRPEWRKTFLEAVPEHARTAQLAADWVGTVD